MSPTLLFLLCYYSCQSVPSAGSTVSDRAYGGYVVEVLLSAVECNGTEESIVNCETNVGSRGCQPRGRRDASVICNTDDQGSLLLLLLLYLTETVGSLYTLLFMEVRPVFLSLCTLLGRNFVFSRV